MLAHPCLIVKRDPLLSAGYTLDPADAVAISL